MLRAMTAGDFLGWQRYFEQEPFGAQGAWLQTALLASTIANTSAKRKDGRAWQLTDFLPSHTERKPKPKPKTADDMLERIMQLNKMFGGSFKDKRKAQKVD